MWLVGVERMVGGFVFQALALHNGRLSAVQSSPVLELVFWLVIGVLWLRLGMSTAARVSASVTSGGLAVFLVMSEPQGGHPQAISSAWAPMIAVMRILVVVCTALPDGFAGAARRPLRQRIGNPLGRDGHIHQVDNRRAGHRRPPGNAQPRRRLRGHRRRDRGHRAHPGPPCTTGPSASPSR